MQQLTKSHTFSWLILWLKKCGLYCSSCAVFLSSFSCASPQKNLLIQNLLIDKEDREVVDDFLRHIAISQLGIYTILGSKPVTGFHIQIPQVHFGSESQALYEALPEAFRKQTPSKPSHNKARVEKLRNMCSQWMKIQHKYIGDHFVINFDETMCSGYLVNIPLVIYLLREHYQDFSKVLGVDFDPAIFSREIGSRSSESWKMFQKSNSSFLWGLLFGFGEKNSKCFQWEQEKSISFPFRGSSYDLPSFKRELSKGKKIENLGIPQFVVYQPIDAVVEKYLLEKKRIIQIYQGKDFAETTVAFLKGKAARQLSKKYKSFTVQKVDGKFIVKECD